MFRTAYDCETQTNGTKIIMDAADTIEIAHAAPSATIDRSRLLIPADGDTITFENIKQPQRA